MATVTRAAAHLSAKEVMRRWKQDPRTHRRQRWLIMYQALVDRSFASQIAKQCGVSTATVHQLISAYNRRGVAAVETPGLWWAPQSVPDVGARTALPGPLFRSGAGWDHCH